MRVWGLRVAAQREAMAVVRGSDGYGDFEAGGGGWWIELQGERGAV